METKKCSKCGVEKELGEFGRAGKYLRSDCRCCQKKYSKNYYKENKEKIKEYKKNYREDNKERHSITQTANL